MRGNPLGGRAGSSGRARRAGPKIRDRVRTRKVGAAPGATTRSPTKQLSTIQADHNLFYQTPTRYDGVASSSSTTSDPWRDDAVLGMDPLLDGLLKPRAGSPAIDAGAAGTVSVDIAGTARPKGSAIDIGAWEAN